MTDSELIADRRRVRRSRSFWRAAAILLGVGVVAVAVGRTDLAREYSPYVAELRVAGMILEDQTRLEALEETMSRHSAKALLVRIDSPGGTVVGGESLFRTLREIAAEKPVVAVMGEMAASGGYMVALGADRIFAREGTITGSIGVILQTTEITGLLEKLGVSAEAIKSAPLKASPSPFERLTPDARAATQGLVDDMYAMFVDMVADRRGLDADKAKTLADGRVYTGRQAVANGLVDAIGGVNEARAWLEEKGVSADLPLREIRVWREEDWLGGLARAGIRAVFGKTYLPERLTLDGLVAVWHPDLRIR
ncbi:MAG: signal peptide peptidase SppA [Azospirillum sp.]|jgi:protease-4|nr:signal peptide peptidase SppA [Azospirillum sp.]MCA3265310.1 signal peptide peptidase SppA [Azospirillum sp.]MCZ8124491.1 signal peptide peptidase SppA [Magnetospirillum sp.]